ncbi:MAG: excinuclease ABC subunit UvrC [Rikenellaceae bacterium]
MSKDTPENLKIQLSLLPNNPGVYRFLDSNEVVIYVGKAKNLKKRVSSYFKANVENRKVAALVRHIKDIKYVVVESESDALLLENSMIKSLQPKYNILLKDDKTYPWIIIKNEPYPRILQTRKVIKDGSTYFGPYSSVFMQKTMLDLVRKLYRIRTCNLSLTEKGVENSKFGVCLEYHIKNCKAPCVGNQSREDYLKNITMARSILRGNLKEAREYLISEMTSAAERLQFEEAQALKDRLDMLTNYESRSVVVSSTYSSLDVFYVIKDENVAFCNYMHIEGGAIVNSYTVEMKLSIEESLEDILSFAIIQVYANLDKRPAREIVVPIKPYFENGFQNVTFTVPQRGDKLKLLELSEKNCKMFKIEKLKQLEKLNPEKHVDRVMSKMQKDLMLSREPRHIECFDNSNIQGAYPVSSCVVFRDGKPSKKDYRHFNIKSVVGIDDFASMKETLMRRYSRMIEEGEKLPDLIVVDGGKGQLSSAYEVLKELKIAGKVEIIGLAKRLEEVFYPLDSTPHYLDKSSETLKVLMYIRDEAHRFGITFHRNQRSKGFIKSEIDNIPGLGEKSVKMLLKVYGSVAKIKKAKYEDVLKLLGKSRTDKLFDYFKEDFVKES